MGYLFLYLGDVVDDNIPDDVRFEGVVCVDYIVAGAFDVFSVRYCYVTTN